VIPEQTLFSILQRCDSVIDDGVTALQFELTTEGEGDNEEARTMLTRAVSAANALRHHLDTFYDVTGQGLEWKESV
jgi:hypothetical protein